MFQIDFGRDGSAVAVTAQRSTTLGSLDRECIQSFKHWRARRPNGVKRVVVPVTFDCKMRAVGVGI